MVRRSYVKIPISLLDDRKIAILSDKEWRNYIESIANDPEQIYYEKEPERAEWDQLREQRNKELTKRYKKQCRYCGSRKKLTIDHIKPLALGGSNELSNLQYLCSRCNSKKGSRFIG